MIADNGIFTIEDKIFIKFFGFNSLVVLQASVGLEKLIQLIDLPLNPHLNVNDEEVILIKKCSQNQKALITSNRIRILTDDLQNIVGDY